MCRAALEALRAAQGGDTATGSQDQEVLRWLETELQDVWTRAESDSLDPLSTGQERQRDDLLEEIIHGLNSAALLGCSLSDGCSSRDAMVPPVGVEPTLDGF